ncbi:MAG: NfeD family protein, partial [Chloroflexota bacterium]
MRIRGPSQSGFRWRWLVGTLLILVGAMSFGVAPVSIARAQDASREVFVVQIKQGIDLGLAPYLARVLEQAEREDAAAVILEIDTPGGRLDAVLQMRDAILASPVRTIAYVNRSAFSAGALVAIAARELYMAPGAVMGAATPVVSTGETADEKVISAVRSTFRATAELRGRDPRVAEAMVDPAVEIEGLVEQGQLLTLTTTEAQQWGYADGVAANRQELLAATGLSDATVHETAPGLAENVVRFLTTPVVASLLISLGVLLIWADVASGGVGLLAVVGLTLLAAFFWGHFLAGLAGWEGVALVLLGLVLLAAEVFLIPGFGVAGILGLAALLGGLFLSLVGGRILTADDLVRAGSTVGIALALAIAGGVLVLRFLPASHLLPGMVLHARVGLPDASPKRLRRGWLAGALTGNRTPTTGTGRSTAAQRGESRSLRGATGVALSDLRPAGIAQIAGQRVDVVTRGD